MDKISKLGQIFFAISMAVFGIQHFIYAQFAAELIPSWIPGRLLLTYFTGLAMIAAGASIIFGIKARLAATLLGLMLFLFVVLLHIPRVAAAPGDGHEWTSAFQALAICGGALILAGTRVTGGSPNRSTPPLH